MFVCFVLYYSDLFVFGLFSHCSSDACLLSNKRQMEMERRGWKEDLKRVGGGKTIIRICCMKKMYFQSKKK